MNSEYYGDTEINSINSAIETICTMLDTYTECIKDGTYVGSTESVKALLASIKNMESKCTHLRTDANFLSKKVNSSIIQKALVVQALASGYWYVDQGRLLCGDESSKWACTWTSVVVDDKEFKIPSYLATHMHTLDQRRVSDQNASS